MQPQASPDEDYRNDGSESLNEAIKKEALGSYRTSSLIWRLAIVTLPLDILLLPIDLSTLTYGDGLSVLPPEILWFLIIVGAAATFKEWWLDNLLRIRTFQQKAHSLTTRYPYLVLVVFMGFFFVEALLQLGGFNLSTLFVALAITAIAVPFFLSSLREMKTYSEGLFEDEKLWLKKVNQQVLYLHIIPAFAARSLSVVAALSLTPEDAGLFTVYFLAAVFLLLALEPRQEHFLCSCRGCASRTSRVLKSLMVCPACRPENFEKKVVAAEGEMAENEVVQTAGSAGDHLEPAERLEEFELEAGKRVSRFLKRFSRHDRREKSQPE